MKSFLIIGLGSFGHQLVHAFSGEQCELMAVDRDGEALEDVLPLVASAKIGDCTRPEVLKTLGIPSFDACFVCMDGDFQSSLEITSFLKEMGARCVLTKVEEDVQAKFLLRNGADDVIYPERDVAHRIAVRLASDQIFDCIELTAEYSIAELSVEHAWVGKTIAELDFRRRYRMSILAIKEEDGRLSPMPGPDYRFTGREHILAMAHMDDIRRRM